VVPVILVGLAAVVEYSIFVDREDFKQVEEEEKSAFVKGVLSSIGLPLDDLWPDDILTVEQKRTLRGFLSKKEIGIDIIDEDGKIIIYHDSDIIAEFFKPEFILRQDLKAKSSSKKLYFEMKIKKWSIWDEEQSVVDI